MGELAQGIAARLRALQAELHLSDREMATRLNVSRGVWSGWVNARNLPSERAMILLCDRTGVDMDWIYRGEGRYRRKENTALTLEMLGTLFRQMQADMRTLRSEVAALREEVGVLAGERGAIVAAVAEVVRASESRIMDRLATLEARVDSLGDRRE